MRSIKADAGGPAPLGGEQREPKWLSLVGRHRFVGSGDTCLRCGAGRDQSNYRYGRYHFNEGDSRQKLVSDIAGGVYD